jgi:tetratricopeptide (TPR) repeat protein
MHPKIRSFLLSITLVLPSLAGFSVGHLSSFGPSIALGQSSDNSSQKAEADRLLEQGDQQFRVSQYQTALQSWQQALAIYQEIKDRLGEGSACRRIGNVYLSLRNYPKAIDFYKQYLAIVRELKDKKGEGIAEWH